MVEAAGPEPLVAVEPFIGVVHRLGVEPARHDAAVLLASDEAGVLQHIEVLHDRRQRHGKRPGQFGYRDGLALAQPRKQSAPSWVGQRGESAVEAVV